MKRLLPVILMLGVAGCQDSGPNAVIADYAKGVATIEHIYRTEGYPSNQPEAVKQEAAKKIEELHHRIRKHIDSSFDHQNYIRFLRLVEEAHREVYSKSDAPVPIDLSDVTVDGDRAVGTVFVWKKSCPVALRKSSGWKILSIECPKYW